LWSFHGIKNWSGGLTTSSHKCTKPCERRFDLIIAKFTRHCDEAVVNEASVFAAGVALNRIEEHPAVLKVAIPQDLFAQGLDGTFPRAHVILRVGRCFDPPFEACSPNKLAGVGMLAIAV
jgi:hypothetical protein